MNKEVVTSLTDEELADMISLAENAFGVFPGSVEAEVTYDITGSVTLTTNDDYSEEEMISALQESIADVLNVHASDVIVEIDPETGIATYTISSATAEEALVLQSVLQEESTNDAISMGVSETIPAVQDVTFTTRKYTVFDL